MTDATGTSVELYTCPQCGWTAETTAEQRNAHRDWHVGHATRNRVQDCERFDREHGYCIEGKDCTCNAIPNSAADEVPDDVKRKLLLDPEFHYAFKLGQAIEQRRHATRTICAYCGEPIPVASNPTGQTPIHHFHDWDCYSRFYNLERGGEPLHLMSHDELVQDGHLFP